MALVPEILQSLWSECMPPLQLLGTTGHTVAWAPHLLLLPAQKHMLLCASGGFLDSKNNRSSEFVRFDCCLVAQRVQHVQQVTQGSREMGLSVCLVQWRAVIT